MLSKFMLQCPENLSRCDLVLSVTYQSTRLLYLSPVAPNEMVKMSWSVLLILLYNNRGCEASSSAHWARFQGCLEFYAV